MKSKKIKSAERIRQFESLMRCPVCGGAMTVVDFQSLRCPEKHTFDFAKQGYVNLLTKPVKMKYEKQLFQARQKMIAKRGMYQSLHREINRLIAKHADVSAKPFMLLDLGCGEGSHLHHVLSEFNFAETFGVGIDISKDGILLAAKTYETAAWFVSDLADLPFAPQSFHVCLNILSPIHYHECKRVLTENGIVIKVVPGPDYLQELRAALYANQEKQVYKNDKTTARFKEHFTIVDETRIYERKKWRREALEDIIRMTPLTWSAKQENIAAFLKPELREITIDLRILVGRQ